ncbi:hypothetical protein KR52_10875 [Synechococcus sp. KORDI-52]|nr:hypothetical protein KR52_10875 [Synechococcus sp. KORDI-52]
MAVAIIMVGAVIITVGAVIITVAVVIGTTIIGAGIKTDELPGELQDWRPVQ